MLGIILMESYFLFVQPNQTVSDVGNPRDATSETPASSTNETSDSPAPIANATLPNVSSTESGNETTSDMGFKQNFSIPKPYVPEFTLKYVDNSYDVPPIYGIDQYTGKTVITKEGYHVDGRMVEFTIKNQPFTSYNDSSGNNICLYYNFRFKGHYGEEWSYYPFNPDGRSTIPYNGLSWGTGDLSPKFPASASDYTVVSVDFGPLFRGEVPTGCEVEFQVQALIGHIDMEVTGLIAGNWFVFTGETSDWSSTQAITIP
jgi:hypothetical protein